MITGIDVSAHQDSTPSLTGYAFLIARAAYGSIPDLRFAEHVRNAREAGLVTGAYLFGRGVVPVRDQVAALLRAVALAGGVDLLALDVEGDGARPAMSADAAREAIELVQATGRSILLYHSTSGYPADAWGADGRWVADYRPIDEPPVAWDIWQKRGSPLDLDVFRGTKDQLRALGGSNDMRFVKATDGQVLPVAPGERWTYLDGSPGGSFTAADELPIIGTADARAGRYVVRINTGRPYDDGRTRPTDILVVSSAPPKSAPDLPPVVDCDDVVTRELDAAAVRAAQAVRTRP